MGRSTRHGLHNPIRWKMVRGTPVHVKNFILALFLMPEFGVEDAAAQLDGLNVMDLIVPRSSRGQEAARNHQEKIECIFINEQHRQTCIHPEWPKALWATPVRRCLFII